MTTVPGHNQVLQQSGLAQELSHQAQSNKPSPDQVAVLQQEQQVVENTTVQGSDASERLKRQKEREQKREARKAKAKAKAKAKKNQEKELALDPDAKGRLLDTRA